LSVVLLVPARFERLDRRRIIVAVILSVSVVTGFAGYAGEQDADPLNDTDCASASDRGTIVHAAELQVFSARGGRA